MDGPAPEPGWGWGIQASSPCSIWDFYQLDQAHPMGGVCSLQSVVKKSSSVWEQPCCLPRNSHPQPWGVDGVAITPPGASPSQTSLLT